MSDEQRISLIRDEMRVNSQDNNLFMDITKPVIELSIDAKIAVNELLDKLGAIYDIISKNTYFEKLPVELEHVILHKAFDDITNSIKDSCYPFFRTALLQQDSSLAKLLLTNLLYHPQEIEILFTEVFERDHNGSHFFEKMIIILSNHSELRYQILSRVMDANFIITWSSNVSHEIRGIGNDMVPCSQNSDLIKKFFEVGSLESKDLVDGYKIEYKTNFIDPRIQTFVNAILDTPDLLKLFFSKHSGQSFLFRVIDQKDRDLFFQLLNRLVDHPEDLQKLVAINYNGRYIFQEVIDNLTDHNELKNRIISQVIDMPFIMQWILETDDVKMQQFMVDLAQDPILLKRFLFGGYGETFNNFENLLLKGDDEKNNCLLEILSSHQELFRELLLTPHDYVYYLDESCTKKQVDSITSSELIIKRYGQLDLLMFLLKSTDQQLLHEVLLIQDKKDGTTIFHNLITDQGEDNDTIYTKLECILNFLNPELLLKQLTVQSQGDVSTVQHALMNPDKKIIDLLCNKLSTHQELLEKIIRYLNTDDQPLADLDKELWLNNVKSLHKIIYKTSKKSIEQLLFDVFLVKDNSGETLFSKLSKQHINLETVEQLLENSNSGLLVLKEYDEELFTQLVTHPAQFKQWIDNQWRNDSHKLQEQLLMADSKGNTFLHYLTYLNHSEKLQCLLTVSSQNEAFSKKLLMASNHAGQCALDWAAQPDHTASQQILERWHGVVVRAPVVALTEQMASIAPSQPLGTQICSDPNSAHTDLTILGAVSDLGNNTL